MVKSENELRKMTKMQLKQWLTKHDQRLPADERLKKYYLDRAITYFQLLQREESGNDNKSNPSRSKIKHRGKIISNSRTKKKLNSSSSSSTSLTPKSRRKKQPIIRTQRRHSSINNNNNNNNNTSSPTPSLTRSKKRIIRVRRKTPTKQSPSMSRSIKKKRERVRRATADPHNLQKEIEENNKKNNNNHHDDDDDDDDDVDDDDVHSTESENGGDYNNQYQLQRSDNLIKRKFVCEQDPEKMTISNLQQWLDKNSIDFEIGQRKAMYVNLVRKYSLSSNNIKKRDLSPKHKKYNSPKFKKSKAVNQEQYVSPNRNKRNNSNPAPPLPSNLRKSPLTPQDDEKMNIRSRVQRVHNNKKSGLLLTPALNKTGISRINTPSKLAMRDEIRTLLDLDADEDPLYPLKNDGVTPGGPSNYDINELNNVLTDLRKECKPKPPSPRIKVFDPNKHKKQNNDIDIKENDDLNIQKPVSTSFINSMIAKITPPKHTSPSSMQSVINGVLTTNKKKHKHSYIPHRTVPSPASPQLFGSPVDEQQNVTPINHYQQKLELNEYASKYNINNYEDEPMSPAISSISNQKYKGKQDEQQPVIQRSKRLSPKQQIKYVEKQKIKTPSRKNKGFKMEQPMESPAIIPSIPSNISMQTNPKNNLSPIKLPFEIKEKRQLNTKQSNTKCQSFAKLLFVALIGVIIASFFGLFDGMNKMNKMLNKLNDFITDYGTEQQILFCDTGETTISGEFIECRQCPQHASFCVNGKVLCRSNYIFADNKCILDGVLVKFAYQIHGEVNKILSERRGKYECGEIDGYTMKRDELISNCDIKDNTKKDKAFEYFEANILPESNTLSRNEKGQYFSYKSIKSPICRIREWSIDNILGLIATFIIIVIVFMIWCQYKRKKWEKKEIDNMIIDIYNILEEYRGFNGGQQHVPIDIVKQRINPQTNKLWESVETLIQNDVNIDKSIRMKDGMQKKCLQLISSQPIVNGEKWNFNTNNNEEMRYPPHSKRNMW